MRPLAQLFIDMLLSRVTRGLKPRGLRVIEKKVQLSHAELESCAHRALSAVSSEICFVRSGDFSNEQHPLRTLAILPVPTVRVA